MQTIVTFRFIIIKRTNLYSDYGSVTNAGLDTEQMLIRIRANEGSP